MQGDRPHAEYQAEREQMVTTTIEARGISDPRVLAAMRRVPRHCFVKPGDQLVAYRDRALPIPGGQTISQPFVVAAMLEAAAPKPDCRCLEVGTGSGYQTAVLAELCAQTYGIEYLPEVAEFGAGNLRRAGYLEGDRLHLRVGDGFEGWAEAAPFDAILVAAAPPQVPKPLLRQLAPGGRLVIPVGPEHATQMLERWTRLGDGEDESAFKREQLLAVRFVPFLGPGAR